MAGFQPIRNLHGGSTAFQTKRFRASTSAAVANGDMVGVSAGVVKQVQNASAATIGVVARCFQDIQGEARPFTHSMPTWGPYKRAAVSGFVDVYDDPDVVYRAVSEVSASAGSTIGTMMTVSNSAAVTTANGQSGQNLIAQASATQGHVRVLGPSQFTTDPFATAGTTIVECIQVRHLYRIAPT